MRCTEPNKVTRINARDYAGDPELYTNNVNEETVMAQCMTGSFIFTNSEGMSAAAIKETG